MTAAITHAPSVAIPLPPTALAGPAFDLPCRPSDGESCGSAPPIALMPSNDGSPRQALRASILTALRGRRAVLVARVAQARRENRRKALWTCEAELRAATQAVMLMELGL